MFHSNFSSGLWKYVLRPRQLLTDAYSSNCRSPQRSADPPVNWTTCHYPVTQHNCPSPHTLHDPNSNNADLEPPYVGDVATPGSPRRSNPALASPVDCSSPRSCLLQSQPSLADSDDPGSGLEPALRPHLRSVGGEDDDSLRVSGPISPSGSKGPYRVSDDPCPLVSDPQPPARPPSPPHPCSPTSFTASYPAVSWSPDHQWTSLPISCLRYLRQDGNSDRDRVFHCPDVPSFVRPRAPNPPHLVQGPTGSATRPYGNAVARSPLVVAPPLPTRWKRQSRTSAWGVHPRSPTR